MAEELLALGVEFEYERPAETPAGACRFYLPDFTITQAPVALQLPRWVEVKPQEMLYTLRDDLRISRTHGERFKGEIGVQDCDAARLHGMGHVELCKPKRLAELTGESVLVVGGVGGTERMSIEMRRALIVFSRSHPIVNQEGLRKRQEREQRRAEYQRERDEYSAKCQQEAAARQQRWAQAELDRARLAGQERRAIMAKLRATPTTKRNKFDARCFGCAGVVAAHSGHLYGTPGAVGSSVWRVLCEPCARGAN